MRRFLIRFFLRLLVVFAVVLGGLLLFRSHYRPLLRELAETQIKNATSDLTNDALTELPVSYTHLTLPTTSIV